MISADVYLQPDAADPVLDPEFVLEISRRHAPSVSAILNVDESGGEARTYLLDGDLVLKTQRPHRLRPRTSLSKEALILEELARVSDLPVPKVLGYGREGPVEYILMTRMPGIAIRNATLASDARAAALRELGAVLRKLHDVDQGGFVGSELIHGDRGAADLRERINAVFARLGDGMRAVDGWPAEIQPMPIGQRLTAELPSEVPLVVLHSNPGPEHTFVHPNGGRFSGIIDFGDAYRSHPALDLRSWVDAADAASLREAYLCAGEPPAGFEAVWRAGLVMMEFALAVRGRREPAMAASRIQDLLAAGA